MKLTHNLNDVKTIRWQKDQGLQVEFHDSTGYRVLPDSVKGSGLDVFAILNRPKLGYGFDGNPAIEN